mgnify:CR=1 FL=1
MLKNLLLILAVCTDSFAASVGLGSAGIKIPIKSALIISISGTLFLTFSVCFADIIEMIIPNEVCKNMSFILLITLGLFNLLQNVIKKFVNKRNNQNNNNPVNIYFNETAADADNSKTISVKEALMLSVALSADSLITGISAGFTGYNIPLLTIMTFAIGFAAIGFGGFIGHKICSIKKLNLGWLSGVILILLAFLK